MVEHIVFFKIRPQATPEQKQAMVDGLKSLAKLIPGIARLSVGENFSDRSRGFTYGLVVRFTDRAALEAYLPHPAHQEVVEKYIRPINDDVLVVDYECE
ncbi:MAG: Dabb family protein [Armatimonadetes bacterium]|nr:Dabb family protein [Armatimonadota bacterium]